jgi:cell division initiation protein
MDLSAIDVQQKTFRERFRGYDPDDVEDFLDRVVETLRGQELKLQQQQEQLDGLSQDLAGTKEAEEAIKRTYITAQRTSQEMVNEAEEKAQSILEKATAEAETLVGDARAEAETLVGDARSEAGNMVSEAQAETKKTREEAAAEHDSLQRRVAQLRTAVSDMQARLTEFAETAAIELEGLGASIDLETHSISEILESAAAEDEAAGVELEAAEEAVEVSEDPAEVEAVVGEVEAVVEDGADEAREAAYLQQPRGQRPWERA